MFCWKLYISYNSVKKVSDSVCVCMCRLFVSLKLKFNYSSDCDETYTLCNRHPRESIDLFSEQCVKLSPLYVTFTSISWKLYLMKCSDHSLFVRHDTQAISSLISKTSQAKLLRKITSRSLQIYHWANIKGQWATDFITRAPTLTTYIDVFNKRENSPNVGFLVSISNLSETYKSFLEKSANITLLISKSI